jgi:hypothetical protein
MNERFTMSGMMTHLRAMLDQMGLMRQLGVVPA